MKTNFLLLPSNLATVHVGKLSAALSEYGTVYHAGGSAERTLAMLIEAKVLPAESFGVYGYDDETEERTYKVIWGDCDNFIIVVAPPPPWEPEDDGKVRVGRGIHDTLETLKGYCDDHLQHIFFIGERSKQSEIFTENIIIRNDVGDSPKVIDQDWKSKYAEYTLDDDVESWWDLEKTYNLKPVPLGQKATSVSIGAPRKRMRLLAVRGRK